MNAIDAGQLGVVTVRAKPWPWWAYALIVFGALYVIDSI